MLTRIRWRLEELADVPDAKVIVGLLGLVALVVGGFFAARTVGRASTADATGSALRVVTLRQRVPVRMDDHVVSLHDVAATARTVVRTQTVHTPGGVRLVTRPVTRPVTGYRVVYRKHLVRVDGKTRTVLRPVTDTLTRTSTLMRTSTQVATVTHQVTDRQVVTVTQPITVVATTTVVTTVTDPVPITVTVTLPGTTGLLGG